MSFVDVRELLASYTKSQRAFHDWLEEQEEATDDAGLRAVLSRIRADAKVRADTFAHHMRAESDSVLRTHLQFDGGNRVKRAVRGLPEQPLRTREEVMEHVVSFYDTLVQALKQASHDAESTPAASALRRWADDLEIVARNNTWFGREEEL